MVVERVVVGGEVVGVVVVSRRESERGAERERERFGQI